MTPGDTQLTSGDTPLTSLTSLITQEDTNTNETKEPSALKFFVGGIHPDCWDDELRGYFSQFASISDVHIMTDRQTRRNRGFGFVTFEEGSNLTRLLTIQDHYIRGKKCSIRQMKPEGINLTRKVFIGGINPLLGEVELEPYFRTWGPLEKVTIMRDLEGNSRGFGFVIFNEEATCKRVVEHRVHAIDTENKVTVSEVSERVG
eukprot:GHVN01025960.1.p1 GENE.GHVN01025960.1~~GHVN01025960.1.p1  ORF type:complete len:221 (-),score=62.91 GHVN01025960.1:450-1058(-)